jgi:hypothetical protein
MHFSQEAKSVQMTRANTEKKNEERNACCKKAAEATVGKKKVGETVIL